MKGLAYAVLQRGDNDAVRGVCSVSSLMRLAHVGSKYGIFNFE